VRLRTVSAIEMQMHLQELRTERALASLEGLATNAVYMAHLDREIVVTSHAYVGAAVTEIATLRAELSGPQVG
jgi:hypothetical protein